jgi:Stress responsive A/B Barrel Domain
MIVIVLRFTFKTDTSEQARASVLATMRRSSTVDGVSFSTVGQDLGDPAEGYTHAYCVAVRDVDALQQYIYDPVHVNGDREVLPALARLSAILLSDDMDPELGKKTMDMRLQKIATYPWWGQLLEAIPNLQIA